MKTKLFALIVLLSALVARAQDASTLAADTALLVAEKAYLDAKVAKLKAEENLQTQLDAASTAQKAADQAAQDQKKADQLATLQAITDLAGKMPAGTHTVESTSIATPKAMQLAFQNLDLATTALKDAFGTKLDGKKVIFVDAIPGPKASFELLFYNNLINEIAEDAARDPDILAMTNKANSVGAAAIITALPSIVSAVGGFFRADYTEKISDARLTAGQALSSLMGKLDVGATGGVYLSLESYAFSTITDLAGTDLALKIKALGQLDAELAAKAKGIRTGPLEKAVTEAAAAVAAVEAKIASREARSKLLGELALGSPQNAPAYAATIENLEQEVEALREQLDGKPATDKEPEVKGLNAKLAEAKAALAPLKATKEKIAALRERIAKLFTEFRSTEGTPPLFVRLVRDKQLETVTAYPDNFRFVSVAVAASPQAAITKKSFWSQSSKASSLVALEYRIADGNSKIIASGILPYYSLADAKPTAEAKPAGQ